MVEGLDSTAARFAYEGPVRELVLAVKYRNDRSALAWLAEQVAEIVEPRLVVGDATVTWPSTTGRRRRRRGFDQAELLARRVAAELGLSAKPLLRRVPGPAQTGRSGADRHEGPAFVARRRAGSVLLVDDVITTGATVRSAAAELRRAGAWAVSAVAVAAAGRGSSPVGTSAPGPGTLRER